MVDSAKNKSFNYLVLMDFSRPAYNALKYVVSLARVMPIQIHLFHVIRTIEKDEHQLNIENIVKPKIDDATKKLDALIEIMAADGINASYEFSFGNLLLELEIKLKASKPDVVIVARRTRNNRYAKKLMGYLINNYDGSFMVLDKEFEYSPNAKMAVAFNENTLRNYKAHQIFEFSEASFVSLHLFHVMKRNEKTLDLVMKLWKQFFKNEFGAEFSLLINSSVANGLIGEVKEKKIDLLCVGRGRSSSSFFNLFFNQNNVVNKLIKKLKIPVLVLGKQRIKTFKNRDYENTH
jgi:nucleotide-binding universal stress UspA family protein